MSRYIEGAFHLEKEHELYQKNARSNKILILRNQGILYSFLIRDNRIWKVSREEKEEFPIGTVVLGKVSNVAKQFHGAFFSLEASKGGKGRTGFLQVKENGDYRPVNRKADGRILCGDEMPVQIIKQAKGAKPPQLTTEYSLAGQTVVVKKGNGRVTYSAKLAEEEKEQLREIFKAWKKKISEERKENTFGKPEAGHIEALEKNNAMIKAEEEVSFGKWDIIFRTNVLSMEPVVWQNEIVDLISQLENIDRLSQMRTAYSRLYEPEAFYLDFIKDQPVSALDEIVTDEKDVLEILKGHSYTASVPVRFYEDQRISLKSVYALNTRLQELLDKKVYMRSGAYLMVEPTEALTAIDVNSGKAEKNTVPEEFYLKTNLEAVKEVCYQLSVRNVSGMILVDFINMKEKVHVRELIEALKTETAKDSVPTCFIDLTRLGLAEITRKKTSHTLQYTLREWKM